MGFQQAADFLRGKIKTQPEIVIVLGSGLSGMAEKDPKAIAIDFKDVPDFPKIVAPGHKGRLVFATLAGWPVVYMQGRFHGYDGYDPEQIVLPLRALHALGAETLIITNASGGINLSFKTGDIMLIEDHIAFGGKNPLIGLNDYALGPRFPDMSEAYDPELRALCKRCAEKIGIKLKTGVYLQTSGPSYETPAEIRFFRTIGADAVGMSTVPEVIAARHMGMRVLGLSLISNMAAGVLKQKLTHQEVMAAGAEASGRFAELLEAVAAVI